MELIRSLRWEHEGYVVCWSGTVDGRDSDLLHEHLRIPEKRIGGVVVARAPRILPPETPLDVPRRSPRAGIPRNVKPIQDAVAAVLGRVEDASVVELAGATGFSRKQCHQALALLRKDAKVSVSAGSRFRGRRYRVVRKERAA